VDTGIGATLREARIRRKVDLGEVEAAIKIRIRYLQAMENEEWDALPGGAYTRGFIRTYAIFLGLDGERLADDYRRSTAPAGGERVPKRVEPVPTARRRERPRVGGRLLGTLVALGLIAVLIAIGLAGGDGDEQGPAPAPKPAQQKRDQGAQTVATRPGVAVRLAATGEVWVCLLDASEEPLVDGQILEAGAEAGPFRSRGGYSLAFGNGSVEMFVDGERAEVPASSSPVGYRIDSAGAVSALQEGERPDCE
jgi:cytoskeleton protein RodZ